jgi:hypothetical protein
MSLFKNLARIVTAPIEIIDKIIVEPIAHLADEAAKGFGADDE